MSRTDILLLIVGLLGGFCLTFTLLTIGLLLIAKRSDDEEERTYLEKEDERRQIDSGFLYTQRHTAWWNQ